MMILGINGLGVSPSACILVDGKLVAMAEEERFNRLKDSYGMMPELAVRYCLKEATAALSDVDTIAFSWDAESYRLKMPLFMLRRAFARGAALGSTAGKGARELLRYQPGAVKEEIRSMLRRGGFRGRMPPVRFVPHHLSHAASAYYSSGYDKASVWVIDGSGEERCTSLYRCEGLSISDRRVFRIPDSLGWFYQGITDLIGFRANSQEGKTMALAAYGEDDPVIREKIDAILKISAKGYSYDGRYSFLGKRSLKNVSSDRAAALLGALRYEDEPIGRIHRDTAFAAQRALERAASSLAASDAGEPGFSGNLCLAGGVTLNCKMNGVLARLEGVERLHVPPFAGDAGSALGAAMAVSAGAGCDPRFKIRHSGYGPCFSSDELLPPLEKSGFDFHISADPAAEAARLISEGNIIAWFRGRMEVGPRALGSRSILASPLKKGICDTINDTVKGRERWRPFAPSILHERAGEYIEYSGEAPFMAVAVDVRREAATRIPAVVHVDGTTRPQLVRRQDNPVYWKLISEFEKLSGEAVILNTSFNGREEPVVCTPSDALRTFSSTHLEHMVMEDYMVSKRGRGNRR